MNITQLRNSAEYRAFKYINERRGWKTDKKIVVIESDDWGGIRMPSRDVYERSLNQGIRVDACHYCKYDSLASNDDLDALYHILKKHRDVNGAHPIITANTIVANPNFAKIKSDNFKNYHFELFTDTIDSYPNHSFKMWQQGIENKIFFPQLHGREHLNTQRWLNILNSGSKEMRFAFSNNYFGISSIISEEKNPSILAALDYDDDLARKLGNEAIEQAVRIFKDIFGFHSKSFIAPNYFWHKETEKLLAKNHVTYLQGGYIQKLPNNKKSYHYLGQESLFKQLYLTRNVTFEPASFVKKDWVASALIEIDKAFKLKSPAIICTHRVSFIGSIFENNRSKNLQLLDLLLFEITKRWPEIEFMSSAQLGDLIKEEV